MNSFFISKRIAWICVARRWCEGRNSINRASCCYQGLYFASHNITCPADTGPVGMHREPSDTAIGSSLEREGGFVFFHSQHSTLAFQHSHPTNLSLISSRPYPAQHPGAFSVESKHQGFSSSQKAAQTSLSTSLCPAFPETSWILEFS